MVNKYEIKETTQRIENVIEKLREAKKESEQILKDYNDKKIYLKVKSESKLQMICGVAEAFIAIHMKTQLKTINKPTT